LLVPRFYPSAAREARAPGGQSRIKPNTRAAVLLLFLCGRSPFRPTLHETYAQHAVAKRPQRSTRRSTHAQPGRHRRSHNRQSAINKACAARENDADAAARFPGQALLIPPGQGALCRLPKHPATRELKPSPIAAALCPPAEPDSVPDRRCSISRLANPSRTQFVDDMKRAPHPRLSSSTRGRASGRQNL